MSCINFLKNTVKQTIDITETSFECNAALIQQGEI